MVKTSQLIDGDHGKSSSQESMEYFRHTSKAKVASEGFSEGNVED